MTTKSTKQQPTARTLEELRKRGWSAGVVERWKPGFREDKKTGAKELIPYGTRVDFLGFADILALDGQGGYLAIQACAGASLAARLHKAMDVPELKDHLAQGNRFQVWGWREIWVKSKGGASQRRRWQPKIVSVVLRDGMLFHEEAVYLTPSTSQANQPNEPDLSSKQPPAGAPPTGADRNLFEEQEER